MHVELKLLDDRLSQADYQIAYKSEGAAAIDLRACISEEIVLFPEQQVSINSGIAIDLLTPGYVALIVPRSGLGTAGVVLANGTGVIDSDYQGEIKIGLWRRRSSHNTNVIKIQPMERVAQLLIVPVVQAEFKVVSEFSRETARGTQGFGSTGRI